jgi:hypothetical protein
LRRATWGKEGRIVAGVKVGGVVVRLLISFITDALEDVLSCAVF